MKKFMAIVLTIAIMVSIVPMGVSAAVITGDKLIVKVDAGAGSNVMIDGSTREYLEITYDSAPRNVEISVTPPQGKVVDSIYAGSKVFADGVISSVYIDSLFADGRSATSTKTIDVKISYKTAPTQPSKYEVTLKGDNITSVSGASVALPASPTSLTSAMVDRGTVITLTANQYKTGAAGVPGDPVLTGFKVNNVYKPLTDPANFKYNFTVTESVTLEPYYETGGKVLNLETKAYYKSDGTLYVPAKSDDGTSIKDSEGYVRQTVFSGSLTAVAVAKEGVKFIGWYSADGATKVSSSNALVVEQSISADTYVAKFQRAAGKVNIDPTMENAGTVNETWLYDGQSYTLIAKPAQGFTFKQWERDGAVVSTNATYQFTAEPSSQVNYTAMFIAPKGSVRIYTSALNGGGTVKGSGAYLPGKKVTLTAVPDSGMIVEGWYNVSQEKLANGNTFTITVPKEDTTVFAKFAVTGTTLSPVVGGSQPSGTSKPSNPKTGDTSNVVLWAFLAILSLGALAVVVKKKNFTK